MNKVRDAMVEVGYKPLFELGIWCLFSPFGEGKEELLKYIVEDLKPTHSIKGITSESVKSIMVLYNEYRGRCIRALETSPILVIILGSNMDTKVRDFILPIIKTRLYPIEGNRKPTIILLDVCRDKFYEVYSELANVGLATNLSEGNLLEKETENVLDLYFNKG